MKNLFADILDQLNDELSENLPERKRKMPNEYIRIMTEKYSGFGYTPYQWVRNEDVPPWQPLKKPLRQCRVALSASGGIYAVGQLAFHFKDDDSFREIPKDIDIKDLRIAHFAYDKTDALQDPNCVFPIEPLRHMAEQGAIGELAPFQYTFMGGIYSARKVRENLAPAITAKLIENRVDILLLVPA
jgi:D-proline reductase (dithiol) PrdB